MKKNSTRQRLYETIAAYLINQGERCMAPTGLSGKIRPSYISYRKDGTPLFDPVGFLLTEEQILRIIDLGLIDHTVIALRRQKLLPDFLIENIDLVLYLQLLHDDEKSWNPDISGPLREVPSVFKDLEVPVFLIS